MWDYDIPPEDVHKLLCGETDRAGHYDKKRLFKKALEGMPWFSVLKILTLNEINNLLTDELIQSLRFESQRKHYTYVKNRLRSII
jgi:hypothetical protein